MRALMLGTIAFATATFASPGFAQDWKGSGRLAGKVMDAEGEPIAGAEVRLTHASLEGGPTLTSDAKGKWAVGGIAGGSWNVEIAAEGFRVAQTSIGVPRATPLEVKLTRAAPTGPPPALVESLDEGDKLYEKGDYAGARAAYEDGLAIWSSLEGEDPAKGSAVAVELHMQIARCYSQEENFEQELAHLQYVLDADPANSRIRMLMAQEALKGGMIERGEELLQGVEDSSVEDPAIFFNIAVMYLNQQKHDQALPYLGKAIAADPGFVDGYYQRGLAHFNLQQLDEAKADLEKVLELAPGSEQSETAEALLEAIRQAAAGAGGR